MPLQSPVGSFATAATSVSRSRFASQLAALNIDITTGLQPGGAAGTDDTSVINSAIAGGPPSYVFDGAALASTIQVPSTGNISIEGTGWSSGVFTKTGTNGDSINNYGTNAGAPFDPETTPPAITGGNIRLSNFRVSGNRGNGTTGNCTASDARFPNGSSNTFATGINLKDYNRITARDLLLDDIATYAMKFMNCNFIDIDNVYVSRSKNDRPLNTDGLHFSGPASEIRISNSVFECGDDPIALNGPEGYGGNIDRALVQNCSMRSSFSMMRVYAAYSSSSAHTIGVVKIQNCAGDLTNFVFILGSGGVDGTYGGVANAIGSFMAENITAAAPVFATITNNMGYCDFSGIDWTLVGGTGYGIVIGPTAVVDTLRINGFRVSGSLPALFATGNGDASHCNHLIIDSLDTSNIGSLVYGGFPIASLFSKISGAGVLGTGWAFPDAVMMNGVPYISATNNLPSIKTGGTRNGLDGTVKTLAYTS